jgi:hypothetical protein
MRGGELGQEYFLRSVVLHTPSEHTFDGVHYPMEVQFIHASPGRAPGAWLGGAGAGADGGGDKEYLVVSAFFSRALSSAGFVEKIADAARAAAAHAKAEDRAAPETLSADDVSFPDMAREVLMQVASPPSSSSSCCCYCCLSLSSRCARRSGDAVTREPPPSRRAGGASAGGARGAGAHGPRAGARRDLQRPRRGVPLPPSSPAPPACLAAARARARPLAAADRARAASHSCMSTRRRTCPTTGATTRTPARSRARRARRRRSGCCSSTRSPPRTPTSTPSARCRPTRARNSP